MDGQRPNESRRQAQVSKVRTAPNLTPLARAGPEVVAMHDERLSMLCAEIETFVNFSEALVW
jgi:hypothetical protein